MQCSVCCCTQSIGLLSSFLVVCKRQALSPIRPNPTRQIVGQKALKAASTEACPTLAPMSPSAKFQRDYCSCETNASLSQSHLRPCHNPNLATFVGTPPNNQVLKELSMKRIGFDKASFIKTSADLLPVLCQAWDSQWALIESLLPSVAAGNVPDPGGSDGATAAVEAVPLGTVCIKVGWDSSTLRSQVHYLLVNELLMGRVSTRPFLHEKVSAPVCIPRYDIFAL